jgi:hypothetical protein
LADGRNRQQRSAGGAPLSIVGYKARFICLGIAGGLLAPYVAGPDRLSFDGMNESGRRTGRPSPVGCEPC